MASWVVAELAPGLTSFPTSPGQRYLFSGIVRGNLSDGDLQVALTHLGFDDAVIYDPSIERVVTENLPPLGAGEHYFRGAGTWTKNEPTTTSFVLPNDVVTIFQMWITNPAEVQNAEPSIVPDRPVVNYGAVVTPPDDTPPSSGGTHAPAPDRSVVWSILGVAAMGAVAYGALTLLERTPRTRRA